MLRISVAPASASSLAGGPGSQMSSQTVSPTRSARLADVDHGRAGARLEVALLVEHAVVGQVAPCGRSRGSRRRRARRRSCRRPRRARESRRRRSCRASRLPARQRRGGVAEEVLAQQQILGRIAGERQLGKQHQLGAGRQRRVAARANALGVAGDVADGGVHLAEREAHSQLARALRARRRSARLAAALRLRGAAAFLARRLAGGRTPGGARERGDRPFQIGGDRLELGQRVEVAEQAEAEMAVVAHHGDAQRLAARERHDRVEHAQAPAEHVQRELRARARW